MHGEKPKYSAAPPIGGWQNGYETIKKQFLTHNIKKKRLEWEQT